MSDWDKSGRADERGRYERRDRREDLGQDRWRGREPRSFEAETGREGFDRYGVRGAKDYRGEIREGPAGRPWRGYGESYEGPGYGRGGVVGDNPALDRVADGAAEHPWRDDLAPGEGRHRGRGPKNYTRSDARIHEDVSDRLCDDSWLDARDIEVQVENGEVTLSGTVETRPDKRRAEDLAEQVSGVKHLQNNLRVRPPSAQ